VKDEVLSKPDVGIRKSWFDERLETELWRAPAATGQRHCPFALAYRASRLIYHCTSSVADNIFIGLSSSFSCL
jgi:hypothetical protein